jgi:putative transcriptional regulator
VPSTAGLLLIAEPMLGDPNFDRTVVLVVDHNPEGAFGLVLNRPTDVPIAGVLPDWALLASVPAVVHVGGPVETESGWALARVRHPDHPGFVPVLGEVGLLDLELDPTVLDDEVQALRLYAGYSGWGPGQLDAELAQEAWIVADAVDDDPFLPSSRDLWPRILARQGGHLARLAVFPPDPSLN